MAGSAKKFTRFAVELSIFQIKGITVVMMSRITGKSDEKKLLKALGNFSFGISADWKVSKGTDLIFLTVLAKSGPAARIAGMEMQIPYKSVSPMLAPNCPTSAVGDGCGGRNPWVTDNAASIGTPT
jgi:hypothetical protein